MEMWIVLAVVMVIHFVTVVQPSNIFVTYTMFSKSHYVLAMPLLKELARSGHNVTVLSIYKTKNLPADNFNEIVVELPQRFWDAIDGMKEEMMRHTDTEQFILPKNWTEITKETYQIIMNDDQTQALINSGIKWDLMITEVFAMDPMIGFANLFQVPVVMISTVRTNPFVSVWTATPTPMSYVPFVLTHLPKEMNFRQRVKNTISQTMFEAVMAYYQFITDRISYDLIFPDPKPSFYQARKDAVSLVLMNSHISLDGAQPLMSNIIEVGGMQVTAKAEPLPADLQTFIDSSKAGVVYFCIGTNIEASMMQDDKRAAVVKVLNELKENVVIKWDHPESIAHVPKGKFYASDWLPQSDILAHPNVKLFVTHGGLMGTTETIYRGVPTLGIPFFGDQQQNVKYQESLGIGVRLTYTNLTEASFRWAINEALGNPKYRDTVQDLSMKFKDRPQQPLETAKWWVEYVIRHKGARFLRSPALKLNWVQYHNLDVYGLIAAVIYLAYFVLKKAVKFMWGKVCGSSKVKVKRA